MLNKNRSIIKQGTLKRSLQPESLEYQVILFDHYLVVAKLKITNGTERYVIQKRVTYRTNKHMINTDFCFTVAYTDRTFIHLFTRLIIKQ